MRCVPPLRPSWTDADVCVCTGQFFDYTKAPLHEQLTAADVTPKYHVFYETVVLLDTALYVHSAAYLAPGGIFLSVGPQGSGIGNFARFAWNVFLKPGFLGGVKRKWKWVFRAVYNLPGGGR